jgi:hypothetical protein
MKKHYVLLEGAPAEAFYLASEVDAELARLRGELEGLRLAGRPFARFSESCGKMHGARTAISRSWIDVDGSREERLTEEHFVSLKAALDATGGGA